MSSIFDPKICIVSLIGKSQLMPNESKAWKLNSILHKSAFQTDINRNLIKKSEKQKLVNPENEKEEETNECASDDELGTNQSENDYENDVEIQAHFDIKNRVLYLNLESIFDTNNVIDIINNDDNKNTSFFTLWENEQTKYVKAVLLLFSLSHIIIVSHPTTHFDITYIRFFRIVDTLRNKLLPSIIDLIKTLNLSISKEWIYAGRPCSPRVLFTFENVSKDILNDSNDSKITKLEGLLEDQIYESLRKSYVITNISNNSLFAIPANNTFVYIHRLINGSISGHLLSNLHRECMKTSSSKPRFSYSANRQQQSTPSKDFIDSELFSNFLNQHINIAFKEGFNDNIGRTNIAPIFELPKLSNWTRIYETLYEGLFNMKSTITTMLPQISSAIGSTINEQKLNSLKSKLLQHISQIRPYADIDVKFSMNRCKKSLPTALNVYQEGLPPHYTRKQHNARLDKARHAYSLSARGPMYKKYLKQLENDCLNIWKQGRQLCESISLTGNPCVNEMHRVVDDEDEESPSSSLPVKTHNSNVITKATSNCGYHQKERIDPFSLKDANFTFYNNFNEESSRTNKASSRKIVYFDFPIFKPTESSVAAQKEKLIKSDENENLSVNNDLSQNDEEEELEELDEATNNNDEILSDLFSNKLTINEKSSIKQPQDDNKSPSYVNELFENNNNNQMTTGAVAANPTTPTTTATTTTNEIYQLDTQLSSKTVYLEGMTHSDCQPGLLPLFSSWSLCSIGKYSDYSVHNGLTQPAFLNGHNYLLPWDINLKNDSKFDKKKSKYLSNSLNKKVGKDLVSKDARDGSSIRCYIGMEYECPCGHRFICSAPDRLAKLSSSGTLKDDATKLLNGDMPLYTACPCRNSKDLPPFMAQLMRVFIAIPSLANSSQQNDQQQTSPPSVHILLQPKVQPNPSPCPIFRPSYEGPIKLTDNSIWVLRLPYIYMGDDGPYYRPKDFETLNNCRVLKGMFTWIEK